MIDNNEEFEYAGFWIRVLAVIIDSFLGFFFIWFPTFIIYIIYIIFSIGWITNRANFFLSVLIAFVTILFWMSYQATPGKMAMHVKIVDAQTGNKPSIVQFIVRYFAVYLLVIPSIFVFESLWLEKALVILSISILVVGILLVAFDEKKQGLHDKLAGTVVIKGKKMWKMLNSKTNKSLLQNFDKLSVIAQCSGFHLL